MNAGGRDQTLHQVIRAEVRDEVSTLTGEVASRPALLKTDGSNLTWACNVKLGDYDDLLRAVPISVAATELEYADIGAAVTLERHGTGRYEIVGFAKRKPGRRVRIPVDVDAMTSDVVQDWTLSSRLLTLGELGDTSFGGGWGTLPLGASAVFRGSTLIEVNP